MHFLKTPNSSHQKKIRRAEKKIGAQKFFLESKILDFFKLGIFVIFQKNNF
uniref:Uncharacterized protein n=1 Tax=viral metagenome TaxID=1070528 RepID=A0A6C0BLG4_9ZZZZ